MSYSAQQAEDGATPRPWEVIAVDNNGDYGEGPDTHSGFTSYVIVDAAGKAIADTTNSDLIVVHEEADEDGFSAWDETGRANVQMIVTAVNERSALQARVKVLERALGDILQCFANGSMPHNDIVQAARAALRPEREGK